MYQKISTKIIGIVKGWTHLIKLDLSNINNCLELQEAMTKRMKNKTHAFNYVSKKSRIDFEKLIKNGELFGIFNRNEKLISLVSIKKQNTEDIFEFFKYSGQNLSISKELLGFLKDKNVYALSDWMSDLSPKNVGVGKYMVNEVMKYLKKDLKADFSFAVIELSNSLSYKLLSKSNLSFGLAHKVIDFKNINGFNVKIPSISIISLLNKNMIKKFYKALDIKSIKKFKYTKNILKAIFLSNRTYDPVLEKDELIIIFRRKVRKIKIIPEKIV